MIVEATKSDIEKLLVISKRCPFVDFFNFSTIGKDSRNWYILLNSEKEIQGFVYGFAINEKSYKIEYICTLGNGAGNELLKFMLDTYSKYQYHLFEAKKEDTRGIEWVRKFGFEYYNDAPGSKTVYLVRRR